MYQNIENIPNAIGIPRKNLCMACIDGKYPTEQGKKLCKKSIENYKKAHPEKSKKNLKKFQQTTLSFKIKLAFHSAWGQRAMVFHSYSKFCSA